MSRIDRRSVIGWGAVVAAAVGVKWGISTLPSGAPRGEDAAEATGYGVDPLLTTPKRHVWPRILDAAAQRDLAALIDIVVPGIDGGPSGSSVGLVAFFDEWLGAPYPDMVADRALIMPLLEAFRGVARDAATRRTQRIERLAGPLARAFARFCVLAAAAYHTTPLGVTALGFVGNEPRPTFDGPPPQVLAHFDAEFAKLRFHR